MIQLQNLNNNQQCLIDIKQEKEESNWLMAYVSVINSIISTNKYFETVSLYVMVEDYQMDIPHSIMCDKEGFTGFILG